MIGVFHVLSCIYFLYHCLFIVLWPFTMFPLTWKNKLHFIWQRNDIHTLDLIYLIYRKNIYIPNMIYLLLFVNLCWSRLVIFGEFVNGLVTLIFILLVYIPMQSPRDTHLLSSTLPFFLYFSSFFVKAPYRFETLIPSVLEHIFIFIPFIYCRFCTVSETQVGIKIVQTLAINLLTSIHPF